MNRVKPRSLHRLCFLSFVLLLIFFAVPVLAESEGIVDGNTVNIREGPGLAYTSKTQATVGQVLTILEEKNNWFKVSTSTGQVGWISGDYVKKVIKKVVVTGSKVNLRQGPGTGYKNVGEVKAGQALAVLAEKNGWCKVWISGGKEAWIAGWLVAEQKSTGNNPANNAGSGQIQINTAVLLVRSGPGTGYALVTKIGFNEQHNVLETKNGWYKIKVKNMEGWVSGDYVKFIPGTSGSAGNSQPVENNQPPANSLPEGQLPAAVLVTGSVVNIRQWNSMDAPVVDQVKSGDALNVLSSQGDWYRVSLLNGKIGWVANWLTQPLTGATTPSRDTVSKKDVLIVPLAEGQSFKVVDNGGRPELVLEGWTSSQYKVKQGQNANSLRLELDGRSSRNYEGKIHRLGMSKIKVYPQGSKAFVDLEFNFNPHLKIGTTDAKKVTIIQISAVPVQNNKGIKGKVIVLDPGHASVQPGGGLDPGAVGFRLGLLEKDVNLSIALKVKKLLEDNGARVVMTHTGSTRLTLAQRAGIANSINAAIFVSIHANSSTGGYSGHSTYYYAPLWNSALGAQRLERQKLATLVQKEMVKSGGRRNIGILEENFAVLRETRVPSILVETAYLSDKEEEILLGQDWYRQKLAEGITNGIIAYFD